MIMYSRTKAPKQNRVTPFSTLIATPARGTLMGNRGCLHDDHAQIRRPFQGQRWIICLLEFKGRKRSIMTPGQYTELFFLDEATALAAGHRPCAECQRDRFNLFREIWGQGRPGHHRPGSAGCHSHRQRFASRKNRPQRPTTQILRLTGGSALTEPLLQTTSRAHTLC